MSNARADKAAFVKLPRAEPKAKANVNQHLHAVGTFVDKEVRMMSTRFTEDIHDAGERLIDAGAHVERLYGEPGRVDPDQRMSSRNSSAHSCAADAGHPTATVPPRRRISMRIAPETGLEGSGSGTKPSSLSMPTLGLVVRI